MSRPRLTPSRAAGHDQHDALLVAQWAAGDALDTARQDEADRLVSSCRDCASLAADLRAVASAMAWEPVPPRRRDFRIDAATAERLRGTRLSRWLRRLALPQNPSLSPVAVGVMSIGLLFVVAGNVWPTREPAPTGTQPAAAPMPTALAEEVLTDASKAEVEAAAEAEAEASVEVEAPVEVETLVGVPPAGGTSAPAGLDALADSAGSDEDVAALEMRAEEPDIAEGTAIADGSDIAAEPGIEAPLAADEAADAGNAIAEGVAPAAEDVVGTVDGAGKTRAAEGLLPEEVKDEALPGQQGVAPAALDPAAADAAEQQGGMDLEDDAALEPTMTSEALVAQEVAPSLDAAMELEPMLTAAQRQADETAAASARVEGLGIESILVAIGLVLAVAGALLLLMTWLTRRAADPLLR